MTEDQLQIVARETYLPLLDRLKECIESNNWPAVASEAVHDLVLPHWAIPSADDDLAAMGLTFGGG